MRSDARKRLTEAAAEVAGLRDRLVAAFHDAIDGDFLVGAGMRVSNEGEDVPIKDAAAKEIVHWATTAALDALTEGTGESNLRAHVERLAKAGCGATSAELWAVLRND